MCRDIQANSAYKQVKVCVHLSGGARDVRVDLDRKIEDIVEVHLDEYAITYAVVPSPPNPNVLYVDFGRQISVDSSNSDGIRGWPLVIRSAGILDGQHVVYNDPRLISSATIQALTSFNVRVTADDQSTFNYTDLILYLTFIVKRRTVNYDAHRSMLAVSQQSGFGKNDWRTAAIANANVQQAMQRAYEQMFST